jgi:hypothetical protein
MKPILAAMFLIGVTTSATPALAFGFLGHVATYAAGSVAAHEAERYIDHRQERRKNDGNRNESRHSRHAEHHKYRTDKPDTQSTTTTANPFYRGA